MENKKKKKAKKQSLIIATPYTPTSKNVGDVLQEIEFTIEGFNKNGTMVKVTTRFDIWTAGQIVKQMRERVKKFKDVATDIERNFNNNIT